MPVTQSLMGKVLEPLVPTLKDPNGFTEIRFSNLLLDYLVNHGPESWRLPIEILILHSITF
jgi:hypothetical protein